ncbi:MAG: hypothetical protein SGPRY_009099 [Prymnesium sp.]
MVVRMWTRGWDVFAPDAHLIFHLWDRCYRSTFWQIPQSHLIRATSQARPSRLVLGEKPSRLVLREKPSRLVVGEKPSRLVLGEDPSRLVLREKPSRLVLGEKPFQARRVDAGLPNACVRLTPMGAALAAQAAPPPDAEVWCVGSRRTLSSYEELAGVDFTKKSCKQCEPIDAG